MKITQNLNLFSLWLRKNGNRKRETSPTRHIFHKSIEIYYTQHMQHRQGSQHPMGTPNQEAPLACLSAKIFVYCVYYADSEPLPCGCCCCSIIIYKAFYASLRLPSALAAKSVLKESPHTLAPAPLQKGGLMSALCKYCKAEKSTFYIGYNTLKRSVLDLWPQLAMRSSQAPGRVEMVRGFPRT